MYRAEVPHLLTARMCALVKDPTAINELAIMFDSLIAFGAINSEEIRNSVISSNIVTVSQFVRHFWQR